MANAFLSQFDAAIGNAVNGRDSLRHRERDEKTGQVIVTRSFAFPVPVNSDKPQDLIDAANGGKFRRTSVVGASDRTRGGELYGAAAKSAVAGLIGIKMPIKTDVDTSANGPVAVAVAAK